MRAEREARPQCDLVVLARQTFSSRKVQNKYASLKIKTLFYLPGKRARCSVMVRHYVTSRKVAGSRSDKVIEFLKFN
jgi:hypothetical protein